MKEYTPSAEVVAEILKAKAVGLKLLKVLPLNSLRTASYISVRVCAHLHICVF